MCGIVGAVGLVNCGDTLLDALWRLEYRGYDSAGIVTHNGSGFEITRSVGKLASLDSLIRKSRLVVILALAIRAGPRMVVCPRQMPIRTSLPSVW